MAIPAEKLRGFERTRVEEEKGHSSESVRR